MKKATRLLSMLCVAALMLFALAACTSTPAEPENPEEGEDQNQEDVVNPTGGDKEYVIYSDNAFAPFEFYDTETDSYTGVDMDILAAIAADQGFQYTVKNEGFEAACSAVQAGQADGMIAGMTITEARMADYDFSDGYFEQGQVMVVAKDSGITGLEDLSGKTIAGKMGTEGTKYAEANAEEYGYEVTYFEDSPTMYNAVIGGNMAACFEDYAVADWAIRTGNLPLEIIGEEIAPAQYGFAVKKGENPELMEMFNKGLDNILANGKYDEILAKYGF